MHAFTRAERHRQLTRYLADQVGQARCGVGTAHRLHRRGHGGQEPDLSGVPALPGNRLGV